jgi:GR25 family glycosyltransferase involved in LPS biosynthesis
MLEYIALAVILIIIVILLTVAFKPQKSSATMEPIPEDTFPFQIFIINLDRKPERYKYVTDQLDILGITGYHRFPATDGFKIDSNKMEIDGVSKKLIDKGKGLAGCASSHIRMWKYIADNNLGWTLVLEDDAHFHPRFKQLFPKYWRHVNTDARIVFPGYCSQVETTNTPVLSNNVGCTHAYLISAEGARHLLNNILPISQPVDLDILWHFRLRNDSYIFNGNADIDGVRPFDYKEANGRRCMFNGIIFQNHEQQGSTIHCEDTVF